MLGRKKAAADRARGIEQLQGTFGSTGLQGFANTGAQANQVAAGALGLQDPAAANAAFQQFQNSTGFLGQLRAGERAITGSAAARGELGSGATLKRLNQFGQDIGQQSFQGFLGNLNTLAGRGQAAAETGFGAIGGAQLDAANQRAESRGKLAKGALGFGGGLASRFLFGGGG